MIKKLLTLVIVLMSLMPLKSQTITDSQFFLYPHNLDNSKGTLYWQYQLDYDQFYNNNIAEFDSTSFKFEHLRNINPYHNSQVLVATDNDGATWRYHLDSLRVPYTHITSVPQNTLTINSNTLSISNGNSVSLPTFTEVDGSTSNELQTLSLSTNTIAISNGNSIVLKKEETYSGTTNSSGQYTVTFGVTYSVAPNIQANIINGTDTQNIRITSITTTGFTVLVRNRTDVVGLLPSYTNVNGATVDVVITEK